MRRKYKAVSMISLLSLVFLTLWLLFEHDQSVLTFILIASNAISGTVFYYLGLKIDKERLVKEDQIKSSLCIS